MLGFNDKKQIKVIKVSAQTDYLWLFWDKDNLEPIPIYSHSLTGVLEKISIKNFTEGNFPAEKLSFLINCGEQDYLLSSGFNTWFSRSALLVLTGLIDLNTDFTQPLTFKPYSPSHDSKAVFCAIANNKNELGRYPENWRNWTEQDYRDTVNILNAVLMGSVHTEVLPF